jgi:hypothetical protein
VAHRILASRNQKQRSDGGITLRINPVFKSVFVVLTICLLAVSALAQKPPVVKRITQDIDDTQLVSLRGNVHPLARAEFDRGAVADSQPMNRMLLLLQRSPEQQTALQKFMEEQQRTGSPNFHAWLTPEQFGKQYGPADADIQAVTDWLTRQGFSVGKISSGRTVIEFSGNVAQVRNAFHTEMHHFTVNGEERMANVSDPQIPVALTPVVAGVVSLHNFPRKSYSHPVGTFRRSNATGEITPLFTYTDLNGTFYGVGPSDFATIYNLLPLYTAGIDGTGQTIAIVGESNIRQNDVASFRNLFGLPTTFTYLNVIVNGPDPGINGAEGEALLDVEWSGAVAKNAVVKYVVSEPTASTVGVDLSALYIIDNNIAGVMSESFGQCELGLGTSGNQFQNALWEQAAAQGITVMVAAGDNGGAGCDNFNIVKPATTGLQVSGTASTPFNVAVGGTDFDQANNQLAFWNPTNTTNGTITQSSAKAYIPEIPWNQSCGSAGLSGCGTGTPSASLNIVAGSGGQSNCSVSSSTTCTSGYAKPSWQTGVGVPADGVRDIPDVSLFASAGFNKSFYIICQSDANPSGSPNCSLTTSTTNNFHDFQGTGGTSASSPAFAGIMALVNQKTGQRQGNANYVLYALAAKPVAAFHDITRGNIAVPCAGTSPNCSSTTSGTNGVLFTTIASVQTPAFTATAGYDMATGLGSVDAMNLVNHWSDVAFSATSTTLSLNPTTLMHGAPATVNITVTPNTAKGDVSLVAAAGTPMAGIDVFTLDNTGKVTNKTTTFLPGGTSYQIHAHYAGDGVHGASDSNMVTVTVNQESSNTVATFVTPDASNNPVCQTSGVSLPYGSPYVFRVDINTTGTLCSDVATKSPPTGTVTVSKTISGLTSPLDASPFALNSGGFFEDQPIQLPAGSYSIASSYSGDASYTASSTTFSVTITKANTALAVNSSSFNITSGSTVTLTALVSSASNSNLGPSGTVQFKNGTTNLSAPANCIPAGAGTVGASCTATLTTTLSMLYPPELPAPRTPSIPVILALLLAIALLLFLRLLRNTPVSRRRVYAYAGLFCFALLVAGIAGCGGGGGGGGKTLTISASYAGDSNYAASSGSTGITVH